jgi:preprotein translocase subunit SecY
MFIPGLIGQLTGWPWLLIGFQADAWAYNIVFALLIIVFTYFYTAIAFNPADVAENMQKQGGFVPGVRPGKATADFIDNILTRVTLPASIALAFIAILPFFFTKFGGVDGSLAYFFGGTSIIIAVGVALDTMQQIEGHLVSRHYDGFLKTGRIKGRSRNRF